MLRNFVFAAFSSANGGGDIGRNTNYFQEKEYTAMSTIIKHREFTQYRKYTMDLAGRPLTLETGKLVTL